MGLARSASRDYADTQADRLTFSGATQNVGTRVVHEFYVLVRLWPLIVCLTCSDNLDGCLVDGLIDSWVGWWRGWWLDNCLRLQWCCSPQAGCLQAHEDILIGRPVVTERPIPYRHHSTNENTTVPIFNLRCHPSLVNTTLSD